MQINLLSPATSKGLKNTNSANKTLFISSAIICLIIIVGYLLLFIFNELSLKQSAAIDEELQNYKQLTEKVNLNRRLINELNNKNELIQTLNSEKLIFSKIITEINSQLPYQVTLTQFDINKDVASEHYKINLLGLSPDVKAISEFERNLQSFNINENNEEKLKFSDSKINLVDQSQTGKLSFNIFISIRKEVLAND